MTRAFETYYDGLYQKKTFDHILDWCLNDFVANATNHLIPTVFEPGQVVDPLTVAVLINAIHFKGKWRIPFEEADTVDGMFTTVSGDTRPCRFMQLTRPMYVKRNVEELGDATVLQLDSR